MIDREESMDDTVILSQDSQPLSLDRHHTNENFAFFHNAPRLLSRADATVSKDGLRGRGARLGSGG